MNRLLKTTSLLEAATGLALIAAPVLAGRLLLGAELSGVAVPVARVLGIALIALGVACWPGRTALCGMLTYSLLATLYLLYLGIRGVWVGPLLWPAVVLHAILTALLILASTSNNKTMKTNILISLSVILAANIFAAETEDEQAELAKKLNNPISNLISVPFQANEDFHIGTDNGYKFTLNVQPVVPIGISKDWNVIIRTILPIISQTDVRGHSGTQSGLGNTTQSFFLSPKQTWNGVTWGLGPVGYYPTATQAALGPEKWGLGPTFVVLTQPGPWTIGVLANQIWSLGGDNNEQNISAAFLQPFIVYTLKTHTSFALNTESTYNWENSQWTVPINLMVQQVFKIGNQPMALQLGGRYYADAPSGYGHWGVRLNFTLLFPTKHETPEEPPYKK